MPELIGKLQATFKSTLHLSEPLCLSGGAADLVKGEE